MSALIRMASDSGIRHELIEAARAVRKPVVDRDARPLSPRDVSALLALSHKTRTGDRPAELTPPEVYVLDDNSGTDEFRECIEAGGSGATCRR